MILLAILFLVTALLYSSVGFGGGSTYLALLLIWGVPYFIFPIIALFCNIIVVSGNCFNYIRAGNLNFKLLYPYLIGSIPLAYIGGSLPVEKEFFEILFPWLLKCEKVFGFNLEGYGKVRIYAFLCERFLPFWFNNNTKVLEWPIIFHDLRKQN